MHLSATFAATNDSPVKFFQTDAFGYPLIVRRFLIFLFGIPTYYRFSIVNKTRISGSHVLKDLPKNNVLFVSNHQTYFADVAGMIQVFSCAKWGVYDRINYPLFLLTPALNVYFIAARETMRAGILPWMFQRAGSISVKRTWRAKGQEVDRSVDPKDLKKISKALKKGWVITFPQGTTKPFMQGRKGTAHLIKEHRPIVIPVVVDGFRRAFDKKGLLLKKKGVTLSMQFKDPLPINYDDDPGVILEQVMNAIEQAPDFLKVPDAPLPQEKRSRLY